MKNHQAPSTKHLILISMLVLFSFAAQAQTAGDTLASVINVDSGVVNIDTTLHTNHNVVVENTNGQNTFFAGAVGTHQTGRVGVGISSPSAKLTVYDDTSSVFRMMQPVTNQTNNNINSIVGSGNPDGMSNFSIDFIEEPVPGDEFRHRGDVVIAAYGGNNNIPGSVVIPPGMTAIGNNMSPNPNLCAMSLTPGLSFKAIDFGWYTDELNSSGCPSGNQNMQMILSNDGSLSIANNAFVGKDLFVFGQTHFIGPVADLNVTKCDNTQFAATISNCGGEGRGLLIKAGGGTSAGTDYPMLEVEDYAGNSVFRIDGKNSAVYARDFYVTINNFPDYVFAKDYKLMNLHDLEAFINTNQHLPQMPTAQEVQANGVSLADMQRLTTQKIEELTLYQIEMNKQLEELKKQNDLLKKEIEELKK